MQDRKGSDPGYRVPGTWYLAPVPHSHISNFNKHVLFRFEMGIWDAGRDFVPLAALSCIHVSQLLIVTSSPRPFYDG
jgi:hypothetical protein